MERSWLELSNQYLLTSKSWDILKNYNNCTLSFDERSERGEEVDGDPVPRLFLGEDSWLNDGPASTN